MDAVQPSSLPVPAHDENKGGLINALAWITTIAVCVVVGLRVFTVVKISRAGFWLDDWHIIAALVAIIINAGLASSEVNSGFGRHAHFLTSNTLSNYLALNYVSWILTFFTLMCTKVSVCFYLLRLPESHRIRRVLWIAAALIVTSHFIFIVSWILQCVPPNAAWQFNVTSSCMGRDGVKKLILAQAAVSAICDYLLAMFPLIIIWNTPLSARQKVGLCSIMFFGIIVGSCCVIRAFLNDQALADDATFTTVANWCWRLFEVQLGVICACIPPLIPFYRRFRGDHSKERPMSRASLMGSMTHSDASHYHHNGGDRGGPGHHPNQSASGYSVSQSEKAYLGGAAVFRAQDIEKQNMMLENIATNATHGDLGISVPPRAAQPPMSQGLGDIPETTDVRDFTASPTAPQKRTTTTSGVRDWLGGASSSRLPSLTPSGVIRDWLGPLNLADPRLRDSKADNLDVSPSMSESDYGTPATLHPPKSAGGFRDSFQSRARRSSPPLNDLSTFYSRDSRDDLLELAATSAPAPRDRRGAFDRLAPMPEEEQPQPQQQQQQQPEQPSPPAPTAHKDVSFSTRDRSRHPAYVPARPAPRGPPSMLVTTARGRFARPPTPESTHPALLLQRPASGSTHTDSTLDVDLSPAFPHNRSVFGRILGVERSSWRVSVAGRRASNGRYQGYGVRDSYV